MAKIVLGAVGALLLVLAGGAGGYLLANGDGSDEREATSPQQTAVQLADGRVLPHQPELPDPNGLESRSPRRPPPATTTRSHG